MSELDKRGAEIWPEWSGIDWRSAWDDAWAESRGGVGEAASGEKQAQAGPPAGRRRRKAAPAKAPARRRRPLAAGSRTAAAGKQQPRSARRPRSPIQTNSGRRPLAARSTNQPAPPPAAAKSQRAAKRRGPKQQSPPPLEPADDGQVLAEEETLCLRREAQTHLQQRKFEASVDSLQLRVARLAAQLQATDSKMQAEGPSASSKLRPPGASFQTDDSSSSDGHWANRTAVGGGGKRSGGQAVHGASVDDHSALTEGLTQIGVSLAGTQRGLLALRAHNRRHQLARSVTPDRSHRAGGSVTMGRPAAAARRSRSCSPSRRPRRPRRRSERPPEPPAVAVHRVGHGEQEQIGAAGSYGSTAGRLLRALAVIKGLKEQRSVDALRIRHLERQVVFERDRRLACKSEAARSGRLESQAEQLRASLDTLEAIRAQQKTAIVALCRQRDEVALSGRAPDQPYRVPVGLSEPEETQRAWR